MISPIAPPGSSSHFAAFVCRKPGGFVLFEQSRLLRRLQCWLIACVVALGAAPALAGPPSDVLLPSTTKGYFSFSNFAEFDARWDNTQIGQMVNDPMMEPFIEDLRRQLRDKYGAVEEKLGFGWDDLQGVPSGELSFGLIERPGEVAATAVIMDVTNHRQQAEGLLATIERNFAARGAQREIMNFAGVDVLVFTMPGEAGSPPQRKIYFLHDNVLCGIDDRAEAEAIVRRLDGNANGNLQSVAAYRATMDRCRREAGQLKPEARWFVEPFGFVHAARTLRTSLSRRNEEDYAKILADTGFDAIQGVSGFVNQLVEGNIEFLNRAAIYAPPEPGKEHDPLRWNLSMRMLQLPDVPDLEPQPWVPRASANYTTLMLEIDKAFDNFGPLFDAIQGHDDAWATSLEGWRTDTYGPQVDVRSEFIANLGERISVVADYDVPINIDSERTIIAIEATNEQALAQALAKWMKKEPDVVPRQIGPYEVWERVPNLVAVDDLDFDVPGFTPLQTEAEKEAREEEAERDRVLPNSASCVALGHLLLASDIEYLREVLEGFAPNERLANSADFQRVKTVIEVVAPGERCLLSFGRLDEEVHPTFELLRQGKMPQANTMLARFLNEVLTTEVEREEGTIRKQRIDGSRLPSFESVRHYLGPAGRSLRSEPDGWTYTDVVLRKER